MQGTMRFLKPYAEHSEVHGQQSQSDDHADDDSQGRVSSSSTNAPDVIYFGACKPRS